MLIQHAELDGTRVVDLRCGQGRVTIIDSSLDPEPGEKVIDAAGGALLPGLHDHHLHLYALASARSSVICGPPQVTTGEQLRAALQAATGGDWIRGIAYHESVAGELDRWQLDKLVSDRPVRIQHRSGKLWVVNSIAARMLELESARHLPGVQCDDRQRPNGRLFRLDEWLRVKLASESPPDVSRISRQLASFGVTGITDASPSNSSEEAALFVTAIEKGQLLQRILIMGDMNLPEPAHPFARRGAFKILLDEHRLPEFDKLTRDIVLAHEQKRPVAIHCVTRAELIFALSCIIAAGTLPGDRIEHASVAPDDALSLMQQAQVAVVTQHGFIHARGDRYLADVEQPFHDLLYRGKAFLAAGLPLAGSSDAPYGTHDPWAIMRAAVARVTATGVCIGAAEKLAPEQALALFTQAPELLGAAPRTIAIGEVADFCLLDRGWCEARNRLDCADVRATFKAGELIYRR